MKWLVYCAKSLTGRQSKSLLQHLSVLNVPSYSIDLLNSLKTDSAAYQASIYSGIKVNHVNLFSNYYLDSVVKDDTMRAWDAVYDHIDVSSLKDYSCFFVCANTESPSSRIQRGSKKGKYPRDSTSIRWISQGLHMVNLLAILKAHNEYGIPIHELLFDPNEMPFSDYHDDYKPRGQYVTYHGYDMPEYGMKRLDSLQCFFAYRKPNDLTSFFEAEKEYDFTFGYAIFPSTGRAKYKQYIKELASSFDKSNLYVLDKESGENTFIDTDLYFENVKRSKYTYVLPAADPKCFSIYRFVESLYQDCLPLINRDCYVKDVESSFGVDLSHLVLDSSVSENRRLELLEHYKTVFCKIEKGLQL